MMSLERKGVFDGLAVQYKAKQLTNRRKCVRWSRRSSTR